MAGTGPLKPLAGSLEAGVASVRLALFPLILPLSLDWLSCSVGGFDGSKFGSVWGGGGDC